MPTLRGILAIAVLCAGSTAQTVTPVNSTSESFISGNSFPWKTGELVLSVSTDEQSAAPFVAVGPLITTAAPPDLPASGLSGLALLASTSTVFVPVPGVIALISCDPADYNGNIPVANLLQAAQLANITAVFYSQQADYCEWQGTGTSSDAELYTMKVLNNTLAVLHQVRLLQGTAGGNTTHIVLAPYGSRTSDGGPSSTTGNTTTSPTALKDPGGPPPSTQVAMVVLYSITGIITMLFLVIIITGAVRAHRHPDRYGPQNLMGGARQSRARGLARAMLDGLPIVKVGERATNKPSDVELAGGATSVDSTRLPKPDELAPRDAPESAVTDIPPTEQHKAMRANEEETGIAAAADHMAASVDGLDSQGCSICTEDFEVGQDQRVLPCDHRYHPACIDPWLLNVSGTCPLCRIDLRPEASRTSDSYDADGVAVSAAGEDAIGHMAPPLAHTDGPAQPERLSVRRSIMLSIIGLGQPDRMSRQQRISALREYRRRRARAAAQTGVAVPATPPEEELDTRRRD